MNLTYTVYAYGIYIPRLRVHCTAVHLHIIEWGPLGPQAYILFYSGQECEGLDPPLRLTPWPKRGQFGDNFKIPMTDLSPILHSSRPSGLFHHFYLYLWARVRPLPRLRARHWTGHKNVLFSFRHFAHLERKDIPFMYFRSQTKCFWKHIKN
jgi:hypothetical protein